MNLKFISIVVLIVGLAAIGVFQATRQTSSPVKLPSALISEANAVSRVRVAGRVAPDSVDYSVQPEVILKFRINDPGKAPTSGDAPALAVTYRGVKPDMFTAGRDVIIDGNFDGKVLTATSLLTQCPSKYEAPKPGAKQKPTEGAS